MLGKSRKPTEAELADAVRRGFDGIDEVYEPPKYMPPWIDGNDLSEKKNFVLEGREGCTVYRWRDSEVFLVIEDETNEILDIFER